MAKSSEDKLISEIFNSINKEQTLAYGLGTNDWNPSDITDWIPSSNEIMDLIITNGAPGLIPVGRITEINGLTSTGKSLLVGHLIAELQKKGGIAVLIDTEQALSKEFMNAIGVNLNKLVYISTSLIEEVFESVEKIIEIIRKKSPEVVIGVFVDSVMGATNKEEDDSEYSVQGYATHKARIISAAMRKINKLIANQRIALVFTNQLRTKLGAMPFSDPYTTSGGLGIAFHSSLRIRLKSVGKIKKGKDVIGIKTKAEAIKSRVGPSFRPIEFDIYYTHGMDSYSSWFDAGKKYGAIIPAEKEDENTGKVKKVKGWWSIEGFPDIKFQQTKMKEVLQDPGVKTALYEAIKKGSRLEYVNEIPEDVEFDDSSDEE